MATRLERLLFAIGIRDEASNRISRLQNSINRTCRQVQSNFEGIKAGALSAAGSGVALYQMINPAVDFNRAVGEVSSLDVAGEALDYLQQQAKSFTMQYGGNAAAVVRASYDIQSAIAGLQGKELGTFTVASATLAKATKADAATITSYMGTMYGIFKTQADAMGKGQWVEQLTGRTALAVQMFKTTGAEMSAAFTSLGANATSAGIAAQEQMAVLGMLQSTMSGSEAGTKYKSFLAGIGGAQKELGLKFTDKGGNMLGIEAIMAKIRGKFGDSLDVNESDLLKKAFGSDEAVSMIKLLIGDTKALSQNINALGKVTGMDKAREMAGKMSDMWGRLTGSFSVVATTFSQRLMPSLEKIVNPMVNFLGYLQKCMDIAPDLTNRLGMVVAVAIVMGGVMGLLSMIVAVNKMAMLGLSVGLSPVISLFKLFTLANIKLAGAMLLNPFTWVVMGLLALTVGVAGLILYWDEFKAAFGDTSWGSALISVVQTIGQWWGQLTTALTSGDWVTAFVKIVEAVTLPLQGLAKGISWIGEKLGISASGPQVDPLGMGGMGGNGGMGAIAQGANAGATRQMPQVVPQPSPRLLPSALLLPSSSLASGMGALSNAQPQRIAPSGISSLAAPRTLELPRGTVGAQVSGAAAAKNTGKTWHIGSVVYNVDQVYGPEELSERMLLSAG